jgi:cyclopropane-fatty-acyl-phospholipid synthase
MLAPAGIAINGSRPWDLQVHDRRFYRRVFLEGSMGAGESYVDGWWDVAALDQFFARLHTISPYDQVSKWGLYLLRIRNWIQNRQSRSRAAAVARRHYDIGNDLYQAMLDRHMQYSCAYWPRAATLDEAQENKLDLICRKLHLEPGMRVLELGGGFGGLARFLATRYRASVVSYNLSHEQVRYARSICEGLPVRFEHADYRDAAAEPGPFDRVVSVGLCEHVGLKNYRPFLELAAAKLRPGGLFLLHTIGNSRSFTTTDPWIERYIFPNSLIPSAAQLTRAMEGLWVIEDLHNFGPDYDRTLLEWWDRFDRAWPRFEPKYGPRFYRMWKYYLLCSAGAFRARQLQLFQFVLSKGDIRGYQPVR